MAMSSSKSSQHVWERRRRDQRRAASSCRGWLGAPIHAAALWPTDKVLVRGEDRLGVFKKTEASHRQFCRDCGAPVFVRHPAMGMTDVLAGGVRGLDWKPTVHAHDQEKVLALKDGLPKLCK